MDFINNADSYTTTIDCSSRQVKNLKVTIENILKVYNSVKSYNACNYLKIRAAGIKEKKDSIAEAKIPIIQETEEENKTFHEYFDLLITCPNDSYYSRVLYFVAKDPDRRGIIQAWVNFVDKAAAKKFYGTIGNESDNHYKSEVYKLLTEIGGIKSEEDKQSLIMNLGFARKYKELKELSLSYFISDIIRYQLYSTTVDMIRNMSFANILKKDIIRKTAEESLEKIDQSLNMIAEKGEYDNYDFTEVFMYLLNAHSLYNIFEQSSIVLLS